MNHPVAAVVPGHPQLAGRTRSRRAARALTTGLLTAVAAGLLISVPARMSMRLVALAAGSETHFSWMGSLGIALIFVIATIPGAVVAAATQRRWRWLGLAIGALALCVPATGVASEELGSTGGWSPLTWTEVCASAAGVYLCIGMLPATTIRLHDALQNRRHDREGRGPSSAAVPRG